MIVISVYTVPGDGGVRALCHGDHYFRYSTGREWSSEPFVYDPSADQFTNMSEKKEKASVYTLQNFSSTAELAKNEYKPPLGSTNTITEKEYNPFDHREVDHPNSDVGSLIHLLKSSLGSGILAMPAAFKNGGLLFGAIGTLIVGFICTHCVHILVKCSHELCTRAKTPSMGFSETAGAAFKYGPEKLQKFSKLAKTFVDVALVLTYYSGNCVYVVFISKSILQLVEFYFPDIHWPQWYYMAMLFIPLSLICQIRQLKFLVPFSMIANVLIGMSLVITLYYTFRDMQDISERKLFTSVPQLPMFFSTVIFAMEGIGVVMPVENTMKKPHHFLGCPGVLNLAMGTVVTLYAVIGFFGYLTYGNDTAGSITLNLPADEIVSQIAKLSIALAIFFTYSLQFYVPMEITWQKVVEPIIPESFHNLAQALMRCTAVLLTIIIAATVGDLEHFIGLVGAFFLSSLGILIPSLIETITFWEIGLGKGNWMLWKNICLMILSMIALVSGSYTSIKDIIENPN